MRRAGRSQRRRDAERRATFPDGVQENPLGLDHPGPRRPSRRRRLRLAPLARAIATRAAGGDCPVTRVRGFRIVTAERNAFGARALWRFMRMTQWSAVVIVAVLLAAALLWRPPNPNVVVQTLRPAGDSDEPSVRLHLPSVAALVAGENRIAFGFTDRAGRALTEEDVAEVSVAVHDLGDWPPRNAGTVRDVRYVQSGWHDVSSASYYENAHPLASGFFTARLPMPRAGRWELEFTVRRRDGRVVSQRILPNVLSESLTPAVGATAPASRNPTLATAGGDLARVDSDPRLGDAELHQRSIADALKAGRPVAVLFASPDLDDGRLSLPVLEIFRSLRPTYGDRVEFVHVEVHDLDRYRRSMVDGGGGAGLEPLALSATAEEWGVQNYPWLFVIDGRGRIFDKLFGPMARAEIEEALQRLLAGRGASR